MQSLGWVSLRAKLKNSATEGSRTQRAILVLAILCLLLLIAVLASVGIGAVPINPGQVVGIFGAQLGLQFVQTEAPFAFEPQQEAVLMAIRLPRVVLGILIGAALSVCGAAVQGLFRNPLADPGLIGISSGAALAAVFTIVLGVTLLPQLSEQLGFFMLPLAAFLGGMTTTILVYQLSSINGRTVVATMLLAGIAINALSGAATGLLVFVADDEQLRSITFWGLGSLGGATWRSVSVVAPFIIGPLLPLPYLARSLNAFLLGEAEARHLGINVERVKQTIIALVALAVGAAVSVSGIIGFVGLVVPHLLRLLVGPDHRFVLPGSALLGAALLLSADLLARTIVAPAELPLGVVTAALGAPFFLALLLRDRQRWEG